MTEKRKSILQKIKALAAKTTENGCTEAEALSAAELVGKLMSEYDISMTELEFKSENFIEVSIKTKSKVASFMHNIITAIGKFTDTIVWFDRRDVINYYFYGSEKDTNVALYLYDLIKNSVEHELLLYKKSDSYKNSNINGKTKTTSFSAGMINRLSKRLNDMKISIVQSQNSERGLVKLDKMSIVEREFKNKDIKLSSSKSKKTIGSIDSYMKGTIAGDKVNITSGIKNKSKALLN